MQFSFFFFCSFLRPTKREKALRFFCTQKEKGNKRDQNSSHSSSLGASGHHHQPVAKRVLFGNDKKKMVKVRVLVRVVSFLRSRERAFCVGRCRRAFSVKKGTTKDTKRRAPDAFEGRRDGKKSTARPRGRRRKQENYKPNKGARAARRTSRRPRSSRTACRSPRIIGLNNFSTTRRLHQK